MIKLDQDQRQIRRKKSSALERAKALYEGRELTLNAFKSGLF